MHWCSCLPFYVLCLVSELKWALFLSGASSEWNLLQLLTCEQCPWHICRMDTALLRASCLTLEINYIRCNEAKIEESEKAGDTGSRTQDTYDLSRQCSATEPQQPDSEKWKPRKPLYVLHRWYWILQLHIWQPHAAKCACLPSVQLRDSVLVVQARGVLGSTPGLLYFRLITSKFIYVNIWVYTALLRPAIYTCMPCYTIPCYHTLFLLSSKHLE